MKIHELHEPPPPELARAMNEFEAQFPSPLGPHQTFRMEYQGGYLSHFSTMGDGGCWVAERDGRVVGYLGAANVRLWLPDGSERLATYVGEVKLAPEVRRGTLLYRLLRAFFDWSLPKTKALYSYVKHVTPIKPTEYTGRISMPSFEKAGEATLFRIPIRRESAGKADERLVVTSEKGAGCFRQLTRGRFARPCGDNKDRSEMEPLWLVTSNGFGCGRLEDRLKVCRVLLSDGSERRPAYLSSFAFSSASAGAEVIEAALRWAEQKGYHALYVDMPNRDVAALQQFLQSLEATGTPGAIFVSGLPTGAAWNINSSEL